MGEQGVLLSRRTVVGAAAAFGACVVAEPLNAFAEETTRGKPPVPGASERGDGARYGFLVRVDKCVDCGKCVDACRLWSRTPKSQEARRKVVCFEDDSGEERYLSLSCMHCKEPSCMSVCPAGAISKGEGGVVLVDRDRCIGCKFCYQACPFEVPTYSSRGMDKCDFCFEAGVVLGEAPHCVQACMVDALSYGKLEDLEARFSRTRPVEGPGDPSCVLAFSCLNK